MDYASGAEINAGSIHEFGIEAKKHLTEARKICALVLNTRPEEIIFTSGGTESNNLAIGGIVWHFLETYELKNRKRSPLPHLITTNIEHPSVLKTFEMLERRGLAEISIVPVEANGIVDPKKIKKEIKRNTVLVSVMYANNEIGTIQPIREIAREIRHYRKQSGKRKGFLKSSVSGVPIPARPFENLSVFPLLHTDAVQAANYLDLNVEKLGVDMLSLSGSKIKNSGRGGLLYVKKTVPLKAIYGGGDQEKGFRPGTENLPAIIKFSKALKIAQDTKEKKIKKTKELLDYFIKKLKKHFNSEFEINGDLEKRLPNNLNITFPGVESDLLVLELSDKGIMVSSKSACKSSEKEGSYVIEAINPNYQKHIGGLRFSFSEDTKKSDIDYTVKILSAVLAKNRKWK